MRIAIIGAAGLIGQALTQHFAYQNEVIALKHHDLDITDELCVRNLILAERPNLIINCAVLGVDACENDPALAEATNVRGPEILARVSTEIGSEIIHFGTNYVFDGSLKRDASYSIDDIANPISVYGKTKLTGEQAVLRNSRKAYIARTSWVFGSGKSSFFNDVPQNLVSGNPFRAVTDVWASTTYISDLVNRVEQILKRQYWGVYHVVNRGVCSYYDFALEAANILNISATERDRLIEPVRASEMQWYALRPEHSPMRCILSEKLGFAPMRDWRKALAEHISQMY